MTFREFLVLSESDEFVRILSDMSGKDKDKVKTYWDRAKRVARYAALGSVALGAAATGVEKYLDYKPVFVAPKEWPNYDLKDKDNFIHFMNQMFPRARITGDKVHLMRPVDFISKVYGDQWDSVKDRAKLAQRASDSGLDISVDNLDKPIFVIVSEPSLFGSDNTLGFHHVIDPQGRNFRYIVVKNLDWQNIVRHELSHAAQKTTSSSFGEPVENNDRKSKYFLLDAELGVRLGEMKRNYFQLTGNIATKETFWDMMHHFKANKQKYSQDVQELENSFKQAEKDGMLPRLFQYLKDHVDKVVKAPSKSDRA